MLAHRMQKLERETGDARSQERVAGDAPSQQRVAFVSAGDAAGRDVDQTASHADKVRTAKFLGSNSQPGGQGDNRKSYGRRLNSQPGGQGENRKKNPKKFWGHQLVRA